MTREELAVTTDNERYWLFNGPCRATLAGRRPVRGRTPTQAMTIDTERLRELAAELGFWPATTDEADIERHRQHNKNADYWLADRPDLVATRPGVRRGHGSGVPDYRRSGGRERRGQALVMLSGGTSTVVSLGRFYEGGDIVRVALFGSKGHTRFDVVSRETGEDPQLLALELQAEAFARQAWGAAPEGTTAEDATRVLELAQGLTEAAGIAVLGAS
jgi:hypothetical protein